MLRHPAIALDAARRVTGPTLEPGVNNGGFDANWLTSHGIPTVTLATGQHNNHAEQEYLDLRLFVTQCDVAMQLALD